MKIKTKSELASTSIAMRTKRFVEKVSNIFRRFPHEFSRWDAAKMDRRKIDRQNRINEKKMNEEVEVGRFIDENLENELRELAKIDSWSIEIATRD